MFVKVIITLATLVIFLAATSCDSTDDNPVSGGEEVPEWILLCEDADEGMPIDIAKVHARTDGETIEFRIEMNGNWIDPHSWESGIDCAIFLDSDQDSTTGLTISDSIWYAVNDIGPDYAIMIGVEGDSLFIWNDAVFWQQLTALDSLYLPDSASVLEVKINLEDIGNPPAVDLVIANIDILESLPVRDWVPEQDAGHITFDIENQIAAFSRSDKNSLEKDNVKQTSLSATRKWRR